MGARRPADKAREGGAPTGRTGPLVYFDRNATMSGAQRRPVWIAGGLPGERRGWESAGWTRRVREEYLVYFGTETPTMSGAKRRGSAGMDRQPNAAWVSLPAVWPGWIAGRAPTGRTGPRGFHHRLFSRDASPVEPPPGELGRVGFATGC